MAYEAGEGVKRTQKLLETLEEKKAEASRTQSNLKRMELAVADDLEKAKKDADAKLAKAKAEAAKAELALEQTRRQLTVEIEKLDPAVLNGGRGVVPA